MLIQPILAYGDGVPEYQIFTGYYNWHTGDWVQSSVENVKPGQVVFGSIQWSAKDSSYSQSIWVAGGRPITTKVGAKNTDGETFTDAYFVVEHQPNSCSEYPANGGVVFSNIDIAWEDGHAPVWTTAQFKPACNSQCVVKNATTLQFTWDTK